MLHIRILSEKGFGWSATKHSKNMSDTVNKQFCDWLVSVQKRKRNDMIDGLVDGYGEGLNAAF